MAITGTITSEEQGPGHRSADRLLLQLNTRGVTADGHAATVLIHNLSATGLLVETQLDLPLGRKLSVELPEVGEVSASVVDVEYDCPAEPGASSLAEMMGCRFDEPISQAVLSAAQLRNPIQHGLDLNELAASAPFGERLRFYRQRRGLSRTRLATLTGLSAPTLWAWETGKTQPRRRSLDAVAAALDVSVEELLTGAPSSAQLPEAATAAETEVTASAPSSISEKLRPFKAEIASLLGVEPGQVHITIKL